MIPCRIETRILLLLSILTACQATALAHTGPAGARVDQQVTVALGKDAIAITYATQLNRPAAFLEVLRGWHQLKPSGIMIWEYWTGYGWPGPVPQTRAIADRLKHYRRYNVRGIFNDTTIQWGPQALELYMLGKLLWNPDLDLREELELYYQNYYGPAAEPMRGYHEAFMDEFEKYAEVVINV